MRSLHLALPSTLAGPFTPPCPPLPSSNTLSCRYRDAGDCKGSAKRHISLRRRSSSRQLDAVGRLPGLPDEVEPGMWQTRESRGSEIGQCASTNQRRKSRQATHQGRAANLSCDHCELRCATPWMKSGRSVAPYTGFPCAAIAESSSMSRFSSRACDSSSGY